MMLPRLLYLFLPCLFALADSNAQDSLVHRNLGKVDSTYQYQYKSLDSLQRNFHHRTDSLQKAYAAPMNKIHASINKLNHKKDSLNTLHLSTQVVTHEIDSLQTANTAKLRELNSKIDKIKIE